MNSPIANRVVLVTGASSGIGREIAQLLAQRGARVFGTARNPKSAAPVPGVELIRMDVHRQRIHELVAKGVKHGDEPQLVAETVWRAVTVKSPRLRYPVGQGVLLSRLRRFAPVSIFDRAIRKESALN